MKRPPTDREILKVIHNHYYETFCSYDHSKPERGSKIFVPIDCELVARTLKVDGDIIFGRLYYHMNTKYRHKTGDNTYIEFFALQSGGDRHAINFPYMQAIYAEHHSTWFQWVYPILVSTLISGIGFTAAIGN